jgi:hypothetical protein
MCHAASRVKASQPARHRLAAAVGAAAASEGARLLAAANRGFAPSAVGARARACGEADGGVAAQGAVPVRVGAVVVLDQHVDRPGGAGANAALLQRAILDGVALATHDPIAGSVPWVATSPPPGAHPDDAARRAVARWAPACGLRVRRAIRPRSRRARQRGVARSEPEPGASGQPSGSWEPTADAVPATVFSLPPGSPAVIPLGLPAGGHRSRSPPLTSRSPARLAGEPQRGVDLLAAPVGDSSGADALLLAEQAGASRLTSDAFARVGLAHRSAAALARAANLATDAAAAHPDRLLTLRAFALAELANQAADAEIAAAVPGEPPPPSQLPPGALARLAAHNSRARSASMVTMLGKAERGLDHAAHWGTTTTCFTPIFVLSSVTTPSKTRSSCPRWGRMNFS